MSDSQNTPDILIVGSGIMGAATARLLREADPTARILMIDGAPVVGNVPGLHLHDSTEPAIWERYNQRVSSGIQGMYTGADVTPDITDELRSVEPGMYNLSALGEDAAAMPASALSWNVGGMGVHWTGATPWPAGDETFDFGDSEQWQADLGKAREVLGVHPAVLGPTVPGQQVLDVLDELFGAASPADRHPQAMPMAVQPGASGPLPRTGPSRIFPPIAEGGDAAFELRAGTLAIAVLHDGGRARGARVRDIASGEEYDIEASVTIVCADVMRTPQLLFASGIRPEALGRYLNEHAFVTSRVLMDLDRFGLTLDELPRALEGEFATDSLWLPQNGAAQPFHGQIMNSVYVDDDDEALAYSVGVSLYTPVESRASNRLAFSPTETDVTGMPRITVEFEYTDTDLALIEQAADTIELVARRFGAFDPETESAVLAPGSSLHQTGTVRMGAVDDGTSVCDPDGRVWGFDGLYLAGNGVIPTPVVGNATLTGVITAVRAARAVARLRVSAA
ncbi:GMC oxidoreductase [Agreia sp. Leaf283]|uniref:GMC oxidoreductase n=1 Tax=Agreia sp. Leaf283 TaxID=1736321 RepID=UPI0006F3C641|nr:GMC oxidoreductase [Agreia sp. Leaf283]KQP56881.1 choline dehydrogenase [Agreia sp. Leaf283]